MHVFLSTFLKLFRIYHTGHFSLKSRWYEALYHWQKWPTTLHICANILPNSSCLKSCFTLQMELRAWGRKESLRQFCSFIGKGRHIKCYSYFTGVNQQPTRNHTTAAAGL